MRRRVVVFFPQNLYPPRSGLHQRGLHMLAGLRDLGCEVTLLSSALWAYPAWQAASVEYLKENWVNEVYVHESSRLDRWYVRVRQEFYRRFNIVPAINSSMYVRPDMRRWFMRRIHDLTPEVILMHYAYWDGLLDHQVLQSSVRIVDALDLTTLNQQMQQALIRYLPRPPIRADRVAPQALNEDFFVKLGLTAQPLEFQIYDRYSHTIAISTKEADIIKHHTRRTEITVVPVTQAIVRLANRYTGPALFATGPNPFNIQGYLYFVQNVLPRVRSRLPSFSLQVTGYCCQFVGPADGVILRGFVPDLRSVYETTRFSICPVFGGTGQQIKIVEAMAHGVPVIALQSAAESSPIRHGANSLIAQNAEEFAQYVVQLWTDVDLCRRLGEAARETIAVEYSPSLLRERLSALVS